MGWVGGGIGSGVSGVGIVLGELWMYPHSASPLIPIYLHPIPIQHQVFPTYPDRIRTARHTPLSPPSPNPHPQYLPYIHPTQLHSRPKSTPTNPIRPYPQSSVHYPTPSHTLPPPNQTHSHTSTQPIYPTIATPQIITPSKPSPLLPYMPTPPQRLSSVLARRTCHCGGFPVPWQLNTNVEHRI